ncbi:MAG: TIGR04211 family SH3 domain-containing protein [Thioalkalispiraceae bacterium]|jgi:uncharacterized protein YgiM (DUF1202 family)
MLLIAASVSAQAASLYVTDRILLGVHQQASEDSLLLKSIPSGTAVELLEKQGNFSRIKLVDGVEGWVNSQYLMNEQPSTARFDQLVSEHEKTQQALKAAKETLAKRERDVQVLRDELSNARTTIREAKKGKTVVTEADPEQAKKLAAAEQQVAELTGQLEKLKQAQSESSVDQGDTQAALQYAEEENAALQARIALALANLSGEKAPTPQELAGIRPRFPLWYWLLMLVALALGVGAGITWMDHQVRKRHGGFRV